MPVKLQVEVKDTSDNDASVVLEQAEANGHVKVRVRGANGRLGTSEAIVKVSELDGAMKALEAVSGGTARAGS